MHKGVKPRRPAPAFVTDAHWRLIAQCLPDDPDDRPDIIDVCQTIQALHRTTLDSRSPRTERYSIQRMYLLLVPYLTQSRLVLQPRNLRKRWPPWRQHHDSDFRQRGLAFCHLRLGQSQITSTAGTDFNAELFSQLFTS